MSKHSLSEEIRKELEKLNDRIDRRIIKGQPYQKEAQRHKELLATLERISEDSRPLVQTLRIHRRVKSPVRRRLGGSVFGRILHVGTA